MLDPRPRARSQTARPEAATPRRTPPRTRASTTARARTPARARAVASPGTTAARARTPARARADAARTRARPRPRAASSSPDTGTEQRGRVKTGRVFLYASEQVQRTHQLRHRHRPEGPALLAHPLEEAGRRLV